MLRLIFLFTFSLSFTLTSAFRWRCLPEDAQVLNEVLAAVNRSWSYDCCHLTSTIQCDPYTSSVISFELFQDGFNGTIPAAIAKFPNLKNLAIHKMPNIHGGIPPSFANLTKLTSLSISWTNVSGPIPSWLGQLTNLNYLDLSFNQFSGSIPPTLAQLSKLTYLRLDRNRLTGPIPESFGQFTANPQIFLSHNSLSGAIPKSLGRVDFVTIDLDRNQLVGDPSHLFNNRSNPMGTLILSRNLFSFDLTGVVFPSGLRTLDFSHNMIQGSIPAAITELNLLRFNMSYNRLCGRIPQGGTMQNFDSSSYMHNSCLCGPPFSAKC